jgi:diphosphomevalonate decarboxylase
VALVKYWGKRDEERNLPAVGSISITLAGLEATAHVAAARGATRFASRGEAVIGEAAARMATHLDWLGARLGVAEPLAVDVEANFPVGAGLASSAAIHAAVATAAASAARAKLDRRTLSGLARVGSGSAARSVYGGFVERHRGERPDGEDSVAEPLRAESEWPLAVVVAVVREGQKDVPSRDGMRHTARTSPLYPAWIDAQEADLAAMRAAIRARDLTAVGTIAEENCLRMHAVTLAARPPLLYWSPATVAAMEAVRALRRDGCQAYFTIDAGPQVKVLCTATDADRVAATLEAVPGVLRILRCSLGAGVEVLDGPVPWE